MSSLYQISSPVCKSTLMYASSRRGSTQLLKGSKGCPYISGLGICLHMIVLYRNLLTDLFGSSYDSSCFNLHCPHYVWTIRCHAVSGCRTRNLASCPPNLKPYYPIPNFPRILGVSNNRLEADRSGLGYGSVVP